MFQNCTDLIYSSSVGHSKHNFLYVNSEFLETLDEQGQIVIQNNPNEEIRFFGKSKSFHLTNVKYLNTLLVDSKGGILRENNNYLKVEIRTPSTHQIFEALEHSQVHYKEIVNQNIQQLISTRGFTLESLCHKFKISPVEFITFAKKAHYIHHQDSNSFLIVSTKALSEIFHIVYSYIISNNLPLSSIPIQTLFTSIFPNQQIDYLIYESACNYFMLPTQENTHEITVECVIKYIFTEMGETKGEYLREEFEEIFKEMQELYLPAVLQKPETVPQVSQYFLYLKQQNEMSYYKKLLLPLTIKELIIHLSKIKKRYGYNEIKGLMKHIFSDKGLQEAIGKHFRKFGEQYELKAIVLA